MPKIPPVVDTFELECVMLGNVMCCINNNRGVNSFVWCEDTETLNN